MMLEIGWKSLYTFAILWNSSENLGKLLETFIDLWNFPEMFGNLQKLSVNLRKFRFCGDEKSHATEKKLAGIQFYTQLKQL